MPARRHFEEYSAVENTAEFFRRAKVDAGHTGLSPLGDSTALRIPAIGMKYGISVMLKGWLEAVFRLP